jgi:hypothetical protein
MQHLARYSFPAAVVLATTFLSVSVGPRLLQRAVMQRRLNNWDVPELVEHLDRAGLKLRHCSPRRDGFITRFAYLTSTDKSWDDLSCLRRNDSRSFQEWRGTVFCERMNRDWELVFDLRDEHYMAAGPFVFYGDVELLGRIRAILMPSESP